MSLRNIHRIAGGVLLSIGLVALLFAPAQGQDLHHHEESQNWYQKLATPERLQEQFEQNPVIFFTAVFVLGIGVSLTPCVLPMIPITASIICGSKQAIRSRTVTRSALAGLLTSLVYVLGVSITYALLGVLAATLGVVVRGVLQGWLVQAIIGALFAVLGLSMIGLFSLPIPGWGQSKLETATQQQKAKKSLLTVFVLGLISGLIASPCVAPIIGALLLWVSTAGIWLGWWTLFVFGWGMGLLLIAVGVTGWTVSSGKWMLAVKAILGVILVLMGALIIVQGTRGQSLVPGWVISEQKQAAEHTEKIRKVVDKEPAQTQNEPVTAKPAEIKWVYSEPKGLSLAREVGKPVIIDFYADWCVYCRKMDQTTFLDKRVIEELGRFVAIKVNLTQITSEGRAAAEEYGIKYFPTYVFIDIKGQKTVQLGYIPPDKFLEILQIAK